MRLSQLFGKTLRQDPAEAETASHRLLVRAGLIAPLAAGVYSVLPLGWRATHRIEQVIRDEMDKAGGQELRMPVLQPMDMWEETGRRAAFGENLFTLKDRRGRDLVLGPTHEEVITHLVKQNVSSYRDLPQMPYQIQTKFRDEQRPRGGLLRVREFDMKDLYSFDADEEGMEVSYQKMLRAYRNIFSRCGLPSLEVEADSGTIGGKDSHEFILPAASGEDQVLRCPSCGYAANQERASSAKPASPPTPSPSGTMERGQEGEAPMEKVATPGVKSIEELSRFLGIPKRQTLKAVFYAIDGEVVFVTIRGDLEVNEVKLKNLTKARELRLATDAEVQEAGLVAGSASAVGLSLRQAQGERKVKTVADDSIAMGSNFAVGANEPGFHLVNANYPRDFQVDVVADIANAEEGHGCPVCGHKLELIRGIEVGHVFKLGTFFSDALGAYYLDREGQQRSVVMGCYGIGVGRLLAAAVEQNHDEKGIVWPPPIAPYHVHIVALGQQSDVVAEADRLYEELQQSGLEVLYDDREESAGVKFNDADLLGMPVRLTVSQRNLKNGQVELKPRVSDEATMAPTAEAVAAVRGLLG